MTGPVDPRAEARTAILARYGSEAAALTPCDRERALREATWSLVMPGDPEAGPSLMGWRDGPIATMPPEVRREVSAAIPLPATLTAATAEAAYWRERAETRAALDAGPLPVWARARLAFLDGLTGKLSAPAPPAPATPSPAAPSEPAAAPEPGTVEAKAEQDELPESGSDQDPAGNAEPAQSGQQPRTREEARAAVRALLGEGLTDREIARRVDVSPSTVAAVRKASA
ncbi:MAG: helix-turn-helix domain-containing protein [Parafilimonas terrae]|nr:helix-turn-helix domain-containing protein [Parafilimonas terrae]